MYRWLIEQLFARQYDLIMVRPYQNTVPARDDFWPFGFLAQQDERNAKRGTFLLQTAAIRNDEMALPYARDHLSVTKWRDQRDPRYSVKFAQHRSFYFRIGVDGQHE